MKYKCVVCMILFVSTGLPSHSVAYFHVIGVTLCDNLERVGTEQMV